MSGVCLAAHVLNVHGEPAGRWPFLEPKAQTVVAENWSLPLSQQLTALHLFLSEEGARWHCNHTGVLVAVHGCPLAASLGPLRAKGCLWAGNAHCQKSVLEAAETHSQESTVQCRLG